MERLAVDDGSEHRGEQDERWSANAEVWRRGSGGRTRSTMGVSTEKNKVSEGKGKVKLVKIKKYEKAAVATGSILPCQTHLRLKPSLKILCTWNNELLLKAIIFMISFYIFKSLHISRILPTKTPNLVKD